MEKGLKPKTKKDNLKNKINRLFYQLKFRKKFKSLNISDSTLRHLSEQYYDQSVKDIFQVIEKSSNIDEFNKYILEDLFDKNNIFLSQLLLGSIAGEYEVFELNYLDKEVEKEKFDLKNREKVIRNSKRKFLYLSFSK